MIFNMVGGGDPDKSGIILNNSQVKAKVPYAFVSIGAAALNASPFDGVSLSGLANSVQYSYIRLGPVDLTNIDNIVVNLTASAPSTSAKSGACLFVAQTADSPDTNRSYNVTSGNQAYPDNGSGGYKNGPLTRFDITLDVSGLTGMHYVYAGFDTWNGDSWSGKRTATVWGVQLNKGA